MIQPHGGKLISRIMGAEDVARFNSQLGQMKKIAISKERITEVENIAHGVFSPLDGFLTQNDFLSVLDNMKLSDGTPWTIPIVLDIDSEEILAGDEVALVNDSGELIAMMNIEDKYEFDTEKMAQAGYCTLDKEHPGVAKCYAMKKYLVGGKIMLAKETPTPYDNYKFWPKQTRQMFEEKGWKTVVGFQTRNTPHNGHEYLQKAALTFVDGLFINPVIGKKKAGDFKDSVILDTYEALIKDYFPDSRAMMGILPMEMRYAGPREAIFHAIIRKNFGCTHFIVGRDHAGVGNYYEPFAAQEIFSEFDDLGIQPMFFRSFFYCKKCLGVMNDKTCPHEGDDIINFAGRAIRQMLKDGQIPDKFLMRPEVAKVILAADEPFC